MLVTCRVVYEENTKKFILMNNYNASSVCMSDQIEHNTWWQSKVAVQNYKQLNLKCIQT